MPNLAIISYYKSLKRFIGDVQDWSHKDTLEIEILFIKTRIGLFLDNQIIEIDIAIQSTWSKSHVILEPVDASNFVHMTFTLIVCRAFSCIEVVDVNSVGADSCCK